MFHLILLCFSLRLCIRKCYCVLEKIVVHQENCLCSGKDSCVPESIVVFSKRLLCSSKDCCVSEQELSCVLPVWATVVMVIQTAFTRDYKYRVAHVLTVFSLKRSIVHIR